MAYEYYGKIYENLDVTKLMQILGDPRGEVSMMIKISMEDSYKNGLLGAN